MVKYLEDAGHKIVQVKHTEQPRWGIAADGYTLRSGAPSSLMVRLEGEKRWRRLMVLCFSNAASHFLKVGGERLFIKNLPRN